jgi:hypothetical protein
MMIYVQLTIFFKIQQPLAFHLISRGKTLQIQGRECNSASVLMETNREIEAKVIKKVCPMEGRRPLHGGSYTSFLMALAETKAHSHASSCIRAAMAGMELLFPRKIISFRSLHTPQQTDKKSDLISRLMDGDWGGSPYDASPCSCDLRLVLPDIGCQGLAAWPGSNRRPNLLGDGTIEEEMPSRLQVPHAKLAEILVRPLTTLQAICAP